MLTMTMATEPCVIVYGLSTSADERIRYIGQTSRSLMKRLHEHCKWARDGKKSALFAWIRKHEALGEAIIITPLVVGAVLHKTEIETIAAYRALQPGLLNSTVGGEGIVGLIRTPEHQQKIADAQRGKKRQPLTNEQKSVLSEILKTRVFTEEHRRRISEKRKAQGISKDTQAKMREGRISSELWRSTRGRKPRVGNERIM